jgi:hypothetical protein
MAKEPDVNLKKEYDSIYSQLSSIEHTGPESARYYLDDSHKGYTGIKLGPKDENIPLVLITSLEYYFDVKAIILDVFNIEWQKLEEVKSDFSNLREKYWGKK